MFSNYKMSICFIFIMAAEHLGALSWKKISLNSSQGLNLKIKYLETILGPGNEILSFRQKLTTSIIRLSYTGCVYEITIDS